ncbi:hypothetical protein ACFYST_35740 [Kitasatospora sp. NPDC004614]|uniref:hypothetical protein n=1 Tax=unclassified Kitasatospora TaxID=2633591 RepID=UPI0036BF31DA
MTEPGAAEPWRTWAPDPPADGAQATGPIRPVCAPPTAEVGALPAGPGDAPLPDLLAAWRRKWEADEWCGFAPLADAIARYGLAAAEALPALGALWKWTPHSAERTAVLRAVVAVAPVASRRALTQGLWDCESGVRLLAATRVPLGRRAVARVKALRDDLLETAEVRRVAAARLTAAGECRREGQ